MSDKKIKELTGIYDQDDKEFLEVINSVKLALDELVETRVNDN